MKKTINRTHVSGLLYEHDLQLRTTGPNSKKPGTTFIMGTVSILTDPEGAATNVVPVHFTYVTETTASGAANNTFKILNDIIGGKYMSVTENGVDKASKFRIDSAIGLNEFFSNRNGQEELVSAKRNEGGFIHASNDLEEDVNTRNTFEVDMLITSVIRQEENPERNIPERVVIKGAIFDFRNALLPTEFIATNPNAMDYFENLGASTKEPVFTRIRGRQISSTTVRKIEEESAFGETYVREVQNTRREWVVTWAQGEPYLFDDESTITVKELTDAMAQREITVAGIKQRQDEYNASRANVAAKPAAAANTMAKVGDFNF